MTKAARLSEFVITAKVTHIFKRRITAYTVEEARQLFKCGEAGQHESGLEQIGIEPIEITPVRSDD